jgi:hypothetical protein
MWIEKTDGVASRVAVGRVSQTYWDSIDTQEIEIVLG